MTSKILLFALATLLAAPALAQDKTAAAAPQTAIFAGGCFWCMESEFEDLKGVSDVVSGYAGPETETPPTYETVSTGQSGYVEAVRVTYDPAQVSYAALLDIFWSNVDPFDEAGQFCDKGAQYIAAIYYASRAEESAARDSLRKMEEKYGQKVVTAIEPRAAFYEAEAEHQDYAKRNTVRYNLYKNGCGRPARLKELKKSAKEE